MRMIFRHVPTLIFSVSTVFMLLLSCYLGWPAGESGPSDAIRTEQVFTDDQMHYYILFCPEFRPAGGLIWEDAAAAGDGAAAFAFFGADHISV